jgi:hypothetical protein
MASCAARAAALPLVIWPWIAAIGVAAKAGAKVELVRSVELFLIAALLTFLPPLIGFTIFLRYAQRPPCVEKSRLLGRENTSSSVVHLGLAIACYIWLASRLSGGFVTKSRSA